MMVYKINIQAFATNGLIVYYIASAVTVGRKNKMENKSKKYITKKTLKEQTNRLSIYE